MKRKWAYTLEAIADATGYSVHTVRRDRRNNAFEPESLQSVALYIAAALAAKAAEEHAPGASARRPPPEAGAERGG